MLFCKNNKLTAFFIRKLGKSCAFCGINKLSFPFGVRKRSFSRKSFEEDFVSINPFSESCFIQELTVCLLKYQISQSSFWVHGRPSCSIPQRISSVVSEIPNFSARG